MLSPLNILCLQYTAFLMSRNTWSNWHFLFSLFWEMVRDCLEKSSEGGAAGHSTALLAEARPPGLQVPRQIIRKYLDTWNIKRAPVVIIIMMILMFAISKALSVKETCQLAEPQLRDCVLIFFLSWLLLTLRVGWEGPPGKDSPQEDFFSCFAISAPSLLLRTLWILKQLNIQREFTF